MPRPGAKMGGDEQKLLPTKKSKGTTQKRKCRSNIPSEQQYSLWYQLASKPSPLRLGFNPRRQIDSHVQPLPGNERHQSQASSPQPNSTDKLTRSPGAPKLDLRDGRGDRSRLNALHKRVASGMRRPKPTITTRHQTKEASK